MIEVFSSGGGTQSTAIALMIVQGKLPKPDLVVIADTGRECQSTWDYLDSVTRPALASVGVEVHRVGPEWQSKAVRSTTKALPPAFSTMHGEKSKLSGYCSSEWKCRVIDRYLSRVHGVTRSKYRKWIGFSMDEGRRAQRIIASYDGAKGLIRLPLIQDLKMFRRDCIAEVVKAGWPTPPRSRCWMCPNQGDAEWRSLSPEEFAKAVEFERELQSVDEFSWLHRSCKPLDTVDFEPYPGLFEPEQYCSSGMCYV